VSLTSRRMDPGHILHGSSREEGSEKVFLKTALCTSEGYQVHRQPLKDSLEDKVIVLLEDILGDDRGPVCMGQDATAFADQGERGVMPSKNMKLTHARGKEYPGLLNRGSPRVHMLDKHTHTHTYSYTCIVVWDVPFPPACHDQEAPLVGGATEEKYRYREVRNQYRVLDCFLVMSPLEI
jgi:hypothetical protein